MHFLHWNIRGNIFSYVGKNQFALKFRSNAPLIEELIRILLSILERLVNSRVILEKIKPLEDKLKYQIDKYVKASMTGQADAADKSKYRANLNELDVSTTV